MSIFFILFIFKLHFILSKRPEYDNTTNIVKKLTTSSKPIALACSKPGKNLTGDIVWYYQSCDGACINLKHKEQKLCGIPSRIICAPELNLEKPISGLYKCYKIEKKIGYVSSVTPIVMYNLQVLESNLEPEFIELPKDVETYSGSDVLFECKIQSSIPLHIKWYKLVDKIHGNFQYGSRYYQLLNTSEFSKSKNKFLSKLYLKEVKKEDSGTYACGTVNEVGIWYKEANLSIIEFKSGINKTNPMQFHLKIILFASATIFLIFTVTCTTCVRCKKNSPPVNQKRRIPNNPSQTDGDTSDYERVLSYL